MLLNSVIKLALYLLQLSLPYASISFPHAMFVSATLRNKTFNELAKYKLEIRGVITHG